MARARLIPLIVVGLLAGGQAAPPVEDEVLANIRGLRIGDHTLGDYALPEPFLRRVADRVIRESFWSRFHRIFRDVADPAPPQAPTADPALSSAATIVRPLVSEDELTRRRALREVRPPLRGFRVDDADGSPIVAPPGMQGVAAIVARRLAADGLLATTAAAIEQLLLITPDATPTLTQLRDVGIPVDLLACFAAGEGDAEEVVSSITDALRNGTMAASIAGELRTRPFSFRPSRPGFTAASESGEHDLGVLRLQLTRGSYWKGKGTGGSLDLARQLMQQLPDVRFLISIEDRFVDEFLATGAEWPGVDWRSVTIVAEPLVVAQWAQDNGKAGVIADERGTRIATLVPRFATRREEGSVFVPGETYLREGLVAAGHEVVSSPLLFQGGNLLVVHDPATDRRLLVLGEAEVYRNTALGLTEEQVLDGFRIEFGVDRCVKLPAVSFHLDYDVSFRAHEGRLLAFVNDTDAALRLVLKETVETLVRTGRMPADAGRQATTHLDAGAWSEFLVLVSTSMGRQMDTSGRYPLSLAVDFAASPADSPVGNLYRVLAALDIVVARVVQGRQMPSDRHAAAYIRSIRRLEADQRALATTLTELGFEVVPIPSLSLGDRSLTAVNAIHGRRRVLMPAYGGLFASVDQAAIAAYEARLGRSARVVVVECGESQRRNGAVHCAVTAYPRVR